MAMVFPSTAGGRGRQKDGSMGAVSGAPLTVTTDTYISSIHLLPVATKYLYLLLWAHFKIVILVFSCKVWY